MPDQATVLRAFVATGAMFGLPLSIVAYARLRRSGRDRLFRLVVCAAAMLLVGGLAWAALLAAPPGDPCPPAVSPGVESQAACDLAVLTIHRGGVIVDAALAGLVGVAMGLVAVARRHRSRTIEDLLRERW